jgi:hypothetical protein
MKRYIKIPAESDLGEGVIYFEIEGEWAVRQVQRYGNRWFRSDRDYHPEIGLALTDQPFSEEEIASAEEISGDEFEDAWRGAGSS